MEAMMQGGKKPAATTDKTVGNKPVPGHRGQKIYTNSNNGAENDDGAVISPTMPPTLSQEAKECGNASLYVIVRKLNTLRP